MTKKQIRLNSKTIAVITFLLLAMTVTVGVLLTVKSRTLMKELLNDQMLGIAKTASSVLDGDDLATLTETDAGGQRQKEIINKLNVFSANFDFQYIYVVRSAGEGKYIFIADADPDDPAEYGETVVNSTALEIAGKGQAAVDKIAISDEWGKFYTAYSPVMTADGDVGGIVGIDFSAVWYESQMTKSTVYLLLSSAFALIVGGGIMILLTAKLRKKLDYLEKETKSVALDIGMLLDEIHAESGYSEIAPEAKLLAGIEKVTTDDIKDDSNSIEKLANEVKAIRTNLKKYIAYVHAQAYTDGMTGVGNKTAYLELVRDLNQKISAGSANFSIAVFDVDYLKAVNDEHGHEMGDNLINGTAACIKNTFGTENVFRIGGDEFIAVLKDYSKEDMARAFGLLEAEIKRANDALPKGAKVPVAFSRGCATFEPGRDKAFKEVFRRADKSLYEDKFEHHKIRDNGKNAKSGGFDLL